MSDIKPFAFVLMPFEKKFDDIYKFGIKAVANELEVIAERVDEQTYSETMLERIYRQISSADFIIADMTGRNPNVFYEVGYAHAKGKICTLLTQNATDIPFDLKHHRHLVYDGSIQTLKTLLQPEITWLKSEIIKEKSKLFSIELRSAGGILDVNEWHAEANVEIVLDLKNKTTRRTPDIEAMYFHTGDGWKFSQSSDDCASTNSELENFKARHFIKSPLERISPGAWAQIKLTGRKTVWSKYKGDELKDSYKLAGTAALEIVTAEGSFSENINLDIEVSEIPF